MCYIANVNNGYQFRNVFSFQWPLMSTANTTLCVCACERQERLIYKHIWQIRSLVVILYNPIQSRFHTYRINLRNFKGFPW
jgi:hypothetical protein